jgi:sulfonate transport system ATP-binding protein
VKKLKSSDKGIHLKIKNLKKAFGNVEVLKGINLSIPSGEFVAIVGKSGCGKSTLLRHIAGLEKESDGEIFQNGERLGSINKHARFMFQDARLLPWERVLENIGVGLGLKDNWKEQALLSLKQVHLEERASDWPSVLSGGQRQRVALARALATKPKLLLLDEPLGALDALTRIEMQELIETIWKEQQFTAVLVTHDVAEAITLADRVILIEDGQVSMDMRVTLPRPRERGSNAFGKLESKVLSQVMKKNQQPLLEDVTTV